MGKPGPKPRAPITRTLRFRATLEEEARILDAAKREALTMSALIRDLVDLSSDPAFVAAAEREGLQPLQWLRAAAELAIARGSTR